MGHARIMSGGNFSLPIVRNHKPAHVDRRNQGSKIILRIGNSSRRPSVSTAPGGVPPNPSPIRRETLAPLAPGASFVGSCGTPRLDRKSSYLSATTSTTGRKKQLEPRMISGRRTARVLQPKPFVGWMMLVELSKYQVRDNLNLTTF
jgi:hypothetical protein